LRTRFGLKEAARRAISILAPGAARWLATSISRALAMFRRGPAASHSALP
jgi:hypothetical protein